MAGHGAALWLTGVVDDLPAAIDVVVPHERRVSARPGLRVHRMRDLGQEAHPRAEAFRDLRRDNALMAAGDHVLRYGWRDVAGRPCSVAAQVAEVLGPAGWAGPLLECPACATSGNIAPG